MTDQDPTQPFQPPAEPAAPPPAPPAPEQGLAAEPPAPPAFQPEAAPAPPAYVAAEPVAAAVPEAAVAAATGGAARKTGRSPLKWIVAAIVVLIVAGLAFGATRILTSEAGDAAVLAWTPADSVVYGELRLDLPGSQAAELPKVMKAFPGFQDQAAFPVKLSEVLDRLVGAASGGEQAYQADIEPWFNGQIGASVGPIPATSDPATARALVLLGAKDTAKAAAWASGLVTESGATTSTESYNGVTITIVTPKDGDAASAPMGGAYAVVGSALAIGDVASVKASIDTGGKSGLPSVPQFNEAEASVSGDRLAFAYLDVAAITKGALDLAGEAGAALPELPALMQGMATPWAAFALRAEDGSLVVDMRSPHAAAAGPAKNTESKIPGLVPPSTVVLVEGHDVAAALARTKDALAAEPSLSDTVKQVEAALALLGGFESMTGWMDEAGIVLTREGDSVAGGLVLTPTDAAAAERLFSQVTGLIQLGGGSAGLSVTTEDHNGTTITLLNLGGLGGILGEASGGMVEAPSDLSIAYAVTDDVVVLGSSPAFVKSVLDAGSGESLADTQRFSSSLELAGAKHAALAWIDVVGLRGLVESMVPEPDRADYDANLKPYLAGFDTVMGTLAPGETIDAGTLIIRVTGG